MASQDLTVEHTTGTRGAVPWRALLAISAGALLLRMAYDYQYARKFSLGWDARWYTGIGDSLADGRGYSVTCPLITTCVDRQTALFPPMLPTIFAGASKLGVSGLFERQLIFALIGSITVLVVGLLGFRVGGRKVAYVAAAIAAVNPMVILLEGALMSEAVGTLLAACLLLLLVDQARAPATWRWFAAGGVCGLAALTRGEGSLWLFVVVGAGVFFFRAIPLRSRVLGFLAAAVTMLVVVSPWMIRNQTEFDHPYLGQPNLYPTMRATNCDAGYYGSRVGGWACLGGETGDVGFEDLERRGTDEPAAYEAARERAVDYATDHVTRWPLVVGAREARAWSFLGPFKFQTGYSRARWTVTVFDWFLLAGAIGGFIAGRRRGLVLWPLGALLASVSLTIAVAYGNPRYLATAGPALAVLTGVALVALAERFSPQTTREAATTA